MRPAILAGTAVMACAVMASGAARAQVMVRVDSSDPGARGPSGIELGVRTGYALPFGEQEGAAAGGNSQSLSDAYDGVVPIWIDAGYRFNPRWYAGAFFQYGIALVNEAKNQVCVGTRTGCSGRDIQLGLDAHYHFMPRAGFDPWIGFGAAYEIASSSSSAGGTTMSSSFSGFQFVNVQLGGDYKPMRDLGVGPFVVASVGEYSSCSASWPGGSDSCAERGSGPHGWLTFGVRGVYDIHVGP